MTKYLMSLMMVFVLLTVGCGHRKGVVSNSLSPNEHTRQMAVGDKMVYDIDVAWLRPDGSVSNSASGTVKVDVREGYKHGNVPRVIKRHFDVANTMEIGSSATGEIDWLGQDADGAVYFLGRLSEGTEWALVKDTVPQLDLPAVLTDKSSWKYTMHLTNGPETNAGAVIRLEKVKTAAGEFEAYKTEVSGVTSDGNVIKGYTWYRPEFPLGVKIEQTISNKKNPKVITHYVQTLKSYQFAN